MGAHVAAPTSAFMLRRTSPDTRFNVAAFAVLGYELDPSRVTPTEHAELVAQVVFYKRYRRVLQFGRLRRHDSTRPHVVTLSVSDAATDTHVVGQFRRTGVVADPPEALPLPPLDPHRRYRVRGRAQALGLASLDHLIELVSPVVSALGLRADRLPLSAAARRLQVQQVTGDFEAAGSVIAGLRLAPTYAGLCYDPAVRIIGDHGSRLYVVEPADVPEVPPTPTRRGLIRDVAW